MVLKQEGVAVAAVSTKWINKPCTCQLPDDGSIYTAELRAILLALRHVYYSKGKSFLILSNSLSSLQSIFNLKYDHPVLVQILELYTEMTREGRDLKPRTNKYVLELWQSEWDEFPENKLYNIFPILKECIFCPRTNRKEETVMAWLHIGHSFLTDSFLLKGEEPPVCIGCDKRLTIDYRAYILLTCSDFLLK